MWQLVVIVGLEVGGVAHSEVWREREENGTDRLWQIVWGGE